jgi:anti-sigma factor RsiW
MSDAADHISCSELVELVTEYLEALSDDERTRVELHLVSCRGCDAYVAQMRQTVGAVAVTRDDAPDPAAMDALLAAFCGWRARSRLCRCRGGRAPAPSCSWT